MTRAQRALAAAPHDDPTNTDKTGCAARSEASPLDQQRAEPTFGMHTHMLG